MSHVRQPPSRSRGQRPSRPRSAPAPARRAALLRRGIPALVLAGAVAFVAGAVTGALHVGDDQRLAERYAQAYTRGDWAALHDELTAEAKQRYPTKVFARAHRRALETATATRVAAGSPVSRDGAWTIPVSVATRSFGTLRANLVLPVQDSGGVRRVAWDRSLAFPGLGRGESLSRDVRLPTRATLLARDGTVLARGDDRIAEDPELAASVTGQMGPVPDDRRDELLAAGVPSGARVGLSGLERALDDRLRGRPGGELRAGGRVLARSAPVAAEPVRTTVDPRVQRAAVGALAGRFGGVVALRPSTGAIVAFAGIPFSGLQPPGSTFKIITTTAALEAGLTSPGTTYPVQTAATIEGVELQNANGESCGGTLVHSFAESCNSVFAPLGVRVGARRLVEVAERFGFDREPDIPGVAESTLPAAGAIGDNLAVGSTAIGQGRVQATTVAMTSVAAAIGLGGRLPRLTLSAAVARDAAPTRAVTTPRVARTMERLMRAVVTGGTGAAAAIPGVPVAGKTGTAELRSTKPCEPDPENPESCPPEQRNDLTDTSAWFVGYAPAGRSKPRIAVGVLLVGAGAGGDSAAPAARSVMLAALGKGLGG